MMHENKGQHIGKAPFLHPFHTTVIDPELETGHSNQCVKLKYLCTALITAWMGADLALKDAVQL